MKMERWILAVVMAVTGGCQWNSPLGSPAAAPPSAPTVAAAPAKPAPEAPKPVTSYLGRNDAGSPGGASATQPAGGQTAVEKALEWASKYEQAMQTINDLQKQCMAQQKDSRPPASRTPSSRTTLPPRSASLRTPTPCSSKCGRS